MEYLIIVAFTWLEVLVNKMYAVYTTLEKYVSSSYSDFGQCSLTIPPKSIFRAYGFKHFNI